MTHISIPDWVPDLLADAEECATLSADDRNMLEMMRNRLDGTTKRLPIGPKQYDHLRCIERKVYAPITARRNT